MGEKYQFWLQMTTYGVIFIFGTIANLVVIVFFGLKMKTHYSFRWFIIQLSIADCICCVITPLLHFYIHFNRGAWDFGSVTCKAMMPIGFITVNVSAWILCAIAYERYRAVALPLKNRLTKFKINVICGFIWIFSIILSVPYILGTEIYHRSCQLVWNPVQNLVAALLAFVLQSILPSLTMVVAFVYIQRAIKQQKEKISEQSTTTLIIKGNSVNSIRKPPKKSNLTTQTLRIACIIFILCSLPYNALYVLAVIMFRFNFYSMEEKMHYAKTYDTLGYWFSILVVCNSFMNAFIYAGKFPRFRKFICDGFLHCFKKFWKNQNSSSCPLTSPTLVTIDTQILQYREEMV